jgi:hypothetical protein
MFPILQWKRLQLVVGKPPSDHYIEQLREDRGKKGDESGGPPAT